jgi:hypothetical protein
MDQDQSNWPDTGQFLAVKFPGISKSWLTRVCEMLKTFGGSANMMVQWRPKKKVPHTEWTIIQECSPTSSQSLGRPK